MQHAHLLSNSNANYVILRSRIQLGSLEVKSWSSGHMIQNSKKNMQPTYIPVENLELCFEVSEDQPEVGHLT